MHETDLIKETLEWHPTSFWYFFQTKDSLRAHVQLVPRVK